MPFFGKIAVALLATVFAVFMPAFGDLIGSFETHVLFTPQTTVSEISLMGFDVQNNLTATVVVSGLSTTLHTHFGIAGIEDVLLTINASIGFLTINTTLAFGRFDAFTIFPFYNSLHFILKRVEGTLNLGGITLTNTAQFQDTRAFLTQTGAYAFGDAIQIQGQTPSGVGIIATAGFCIRNQTTSIKKHLGLSRFNVNPDCFDQPKPDMLFDFETISISNIPLAPNLTASARISCETTNPCGLIQTISFVGQPIPITAGITFNNITNLTFSGSTITLQSESATLILALSPTGSISFSTITISPNLRPDPITARLSATFVPGVGLTTAVISLSFLPPTGIGLGMTFTFGGGPPAELTVIRATLSVPGEVVSLRTLAEFTPSELNFAELFLTVNF